MRWQVITFFLLLGIALAEIQIPDLPGRPNSIDDVAFIKERCDKKGKTDTYDRLKVAINETRECIQGKIDPTKIKDELEEAKKTGSMDEVFGKYCNKRFEYKNCIMKTLNVTKECLEEGEINAIDTITRVIEEVAEFACFRDGDRLAMFVAEGGIECVNSRTDQIRDCINATLKIDTSNLSLTSVPTNLPSLKIDKQKCDDLATIRNCVVTDLENNCKDTTPANIIDALFKFITKTTCKNIKQKRSLKIWRAKRDLDFHAMRMLNSTAINKKIAEQCRKNGGEQAVNEFWSTTSSVQSCFGKSRIFISPKEDYLNNIRNCTQENISKIEKCLPEELKFYPNFIFKMIESLVEFAYDHLDLSKLTPKNEIVFCLQRIKAAGGIQKNIPHCTEGIIPNKTEIMNAIPNKTTVCNMWRNMDNCLNNFVKQKCAPDIAIDKFLGNLTIAIQKPCVNEFE